MDYNKARTFITVVDANSITAAANRLSRTQQAISLQLQQLEQELELSLFDRQGPKLILTLEGKQLYDIFKPHLVSIDNGVATIKSSKQQSSGIIRLGAWMEQCINYLPEMIRHFKKKYPLVQFELLLANDHEIERLLLNNKIDIGLQVFCQDKKFFKCDAVYRQALLPVVSRLFLQKYEQPKSIIDMFSLPILDYTDEYSAFNQWIKKNSCDLLALARKKSRAVTISNNVILKQLVLQGIGIGFLHQESIQAELDIGELIPLFPVLRTKCLYQDIYVEIDIVYKRKHSLGFIHQEFANFLRQYKTSWMVEIRK